VACDGKGGDRSGEGEIVINRGFKKLFKGGLYIFYKGMFSFGPILDVGLFI
jgi:hypothetical protein